MIQYNGIIQWKDKCIQNPEVGYDIFKIPAEGELVVVVEDGRYLVVPYSNQERILGVVTEITCQSQPGVMRATLKHVGG